jgi:heterodisulfide reductase subunit B
MTRTRLAATALALVFTTSLAGMALAQDASQTVMSTCTKCHNPKRICSNLGVKDKAAWDVTVAKMVKNGAKLAESEKPAVVEWLAAQKAGAKPVCE